MTEPRQWGCNGEAYWATGSTAAEVKPGVYQFAHQPNGIALTPIDLVTDDLMELPDPTCAEVLAGIEKFWQMEERYRKHKLLYKRSIGLWGPPGSGKTATISLLAQRFVACGGLAILFNGIAPDGLPVVRSIEPKRRVLCIMEELDDLLVSYEDEILSLLDGETQIDNIVYLATTNYFDKLPATIVNRPSRFDEWIEVPMPSPACRTAYLSKIARELPEDRIACWVRDTEGFSIAHLKELAVAVLCLDSPYDSVLKRLKDMIGAKTEE